MESTPALPLKIQISNLLKAKQYAPASELITREEFSNEITENGMDIIPEICQHGLNETEDILEIEICADMLKYIAKLSDLKLAVIELLEQAEGFKFSTKFPIFVQPLKIILSRMTNRKPTNIAWILSSLHSYLKTFHTIPGIINKYKIQDPTVLQSDPTIRHMFHFYNELCTFYEELIPEFFGSASSEQSSSDQTNINVLRNLFRDNVVDLLGPPLVHMNLTWCFDPEAEQSVKSGFKKIVPNVVPEIKSEARLIAEKIMQILLSLRFDRNHFIGWVEKKQLSNHNNLPKPRNSEASDSDSDDDVDFKKDYGFIEPQLTAVSCYMYLIYGEKLASSLLPSATYSPSYIFCTNLYLVNEFLSPSIENESSHLKGLKLARGMLELRSSASPLTADVFGESQHLAFLDRLGTLVVFSESRPVRVTGIDVFTKYIWSFDAVGKSRALTHLFNTVKDPGLMGYCITQLKEFICIALKEQEEKVTGENTMAKCFLHANLINIMRPLCSLDCGVQTDLVTSCNEIIPMLNLLRFLLIRDASGNLSGIKEIKQHIGSNFLKPLRTALDLSKLHFKARLEEVKNSEDTKKLDSGDAEVSISIGISGEEVSSVENTKENLMQYINSALGTIDLLESLLARVNELR